MGLKILKSREKYQSSSDSSISSPELGGKIKKFSLFRAPLASGKAVAVVPATPVHQPQNFPSTSTPCVNAVPPFQLSQTLLSPVSKEIAEDSFKKPLLRKPSVAREQAFDNLLTSPACQDTSSKLVVNRREKPLTLRHNEADVERTRQYGGKPGANIWPDDLQDSEIIINSPAKEKLNGEHPKVSAPEPVSKPFDTQKLEAVKKRVFAEDPGESTPKNNVEALKPVPAQATKRGNFRTGSTLNKLSNPNQNSTPNRLGKERLSEKSNLRLGEQKPRRRSERRSRNETTTSKDKNDTVVQSSGDEETKENSTTSRIDPLQNGDSAEETKQNSRTSRIGPVQNGDSAEGTKQNNRTSRIGPVQNGDSAEETKQNNRTSRIGLVQNEDSVRPLLNSSGTRKSTRIQGTDSSSVLEDVPGVNDNEVHAVHRSLVEKDKATPLKSGEKETQSRVFITRVSASGKKKRKSALVQEDGGLPTPQKQNLGDSSKEDEAVSAEQTLTLVDGKLDGLDDRLQKQRTLLDEDELPVLDKFLIEVGFRRKSLSEISNLEDKNARNGFQENSEATRTVGRSPTHDECVDSSEHMGPNRSSCRADSVARAESERTILTHQGSGKTRVTVVESSDSEASIQEPSKQKRIVTKQTGIPGSGRKAIGKVPDSTTKEQRNKREATVEDKNGDEADASVGEAVINEDEARASVGKEEASAKETEKNEAKANVGEAGDDDRGKKERKRTREETKPREKVDGRKKKRVKKSVSTVTGTTTAPNFSVSDRPKRERRRPGDYWVSAPSIISPARKNKVPLVTHNGMSKPPALDCSSGSEDDFKPMKKRQRFKKLGCGPRLHEDSENRFEKPGQVRTVQPKKRRLLSKVAVKESRMLSQSSFGVTSQLSAGSDLPKASLRLISHADDVTLRNKNSGLTTENSKVRIGSTVSWKTLTGSLVELDPNAVSGPQVDVFKNEVYVVVEGSIVLEILGEEDKRIIILKACDTAVVPAGSKFTIRNNGSSKARLNVLNFVDTV